MKPPTKRDSFTNYFGTQAHQINRAMSAKPQSVSDLNGQLEGMTESRIRDHLRFLKEKGFASQNNDKSWQLSAEGVSTWKQMPSDPDAEPPFVPKVADEEHAVAEGKLVLRQHYERERSGKKAAEKKQQRLDETGSLRCEVCFFDFQETYGDRGIGFAECHHLDPIAESQPDRETVLADLAIVCPNCHRMLHRDPYLSMSCVGFAAKLCTAGSPLLPPPKRRPTPLRDAEVVSERLDKRMVMNPSGRFTSAQVGPRTSALIWRKGFTM